MSLHRSPCELYLKYLIVRHEHYTDEQIVEICREQELDVLGGFYVRKLRTELVVPVPFYPEVRSHVESFRFLLRHGLVPLFHPDRHMQIATRLLGYPRAKEQIETMLISRAPMGWVGAALTKEGYKSTPEAIKLYKAHYFDIDILDVTQLRAALRLRMETSAAGSTDPDVTRAQAAYERAKRHDPRIAAANAPIASLAAMVAALRIGIRPDANALANLAATSRTMAVLRMIEAATRDGFDDALRAAQWAAVAKVSGDILQDVGSPEADFNSKLMSVTMQTEESAVPMLDVLSGGNHTGEIEKRGEDDAEPEPGPAGSTRGSTG